MLVIEKYACILCEGGFGKFCSLSNICKFIPSMYICVLLTVEGI